MVVRPSTKSVGAVGTVWGCQRIWLGSALRVAGFEHKRGCEYGLRGECSTAGRILYSQLRGQGRTFQFTLPLTPTEHQRCGALQFQTCAKMAW
jgi:hypothetical protein